MSGEIAVIGMAGRFPGAENLDAFWDNLAAGIESISRFSRSDLLDAGIPPEWIESQNYVPAAGTLDDIDMFDADLFGVHPREAQALDPQHRVFLECAWQAFEDALHDPAPFRGRIGVWAGCLMSAYYAELYRHPRFVEQVGHFTALISNDKDYLATRASYKLNLTGPSVTVQTACSTSLVAVCEARQALLDGRCDMALAGGVAIRVPHRAGYFYQPEGIYSPDGHCRAFDARGQGTVFGNGVGVVVLRRLEDARADGDRVRAVIRGAATNNDGAAKVGFTAPSVTGQAAVIAAAQDEAGVPPESIGYVEAHGTGTALGDPVEVEALTKVFRRKTNGQGFCALGSVKTNIGHLDTAAGIAGFIKAVLALEHATIPPSLHFDVPNPHIDFDGSPFYVPTRSIPWDRDGTPRRAGVSSFGVGGTNAHVVLEEAEPVPTHDARRLEEPAVLTISRRSPAALAQSVRDLATLIDGPAAPLGDVAYSLQLGRRHHDFRRAVTARPQDDIAALLRASAAELDARPATAARRRPVVFLCSGQGSQHYRMASELYETQPPFRAAVDDCADRFRPHLNADIREAIYGVRDPAAAEAALADTATAQPALFTVEYAIARLWEAWGIRPDALIGHSIGEIVTACLAGVFRLDDAVRFVAVRGRLMQAQPRGTMLAVPLPERDVLPFLPASCAVAALNEASVTVVSGPFKDMAAVEHRLAGRGIAAVRLRTSHAFHSPMMDPAVGPLAAVLAGVEMRAPATPIASNVSGTWLRDEEATSPDYWAGHLRATVRFGDCLRAAVGEFDRPPIFLEIGPGGALSSVARRETADLGASAFSSLPHKDDVHGDAAHFWQAAGRLWETGYEVDWAAAHEGHGHRRCPLPPSRLQRRSYWVGRSGGRADVGEWFAVPRWRPAPLPDQQVAAAQDGPWLVVADGGGVADALVSALRRKGIEATVARPGPGFAATGSDEHVLDPTECIDFGALLDDLAVQGRSPAVVVDARLVDRDRSDSADPITGLLALATALAERAPRDSVRLAILARESCAIGDGDAIVPRKAAALAIGTVLAQEVPSVRVGTVDLGDICAAQVAEMILREIGAPGNAVALRGGERFVRSFEPVRIGRQRTQRLRDRGVYVVTGGLGGIGRSLALELARSVSARLVLLGRRTLPDRTCWADVLQNGDPAAAAVEAVTAMEAAGAEVLPLAADVTDVEQLGKALAAARERFGPISGVIHAAGVPGGRVLALENPQSFAQVLAPKITGTVLLHELTRDDPLDFFFLCSSLTSVLGGQGQASYSVANAFLDAFAVAARRPSTVLSVNWDTWREVGMAKQTVVPDALRPVREAMLRRGMSTEDGIEVFRRALEADCPQLLVAVAGADALRADRASVETPAADPNSASFPRPAMDTPYAPPSNPMEQRLAEIWEQLLGISGIGIDDNFIRDLGGQSLLGTQILSRVREAFAVQITLRDFFAAPTIRNLAAACAEGHQPAAVAVPPLVAVRRADYLAELPS